jgi:hypothetical protein
MNILTINSASSSGSVSFKDFLIKNPSSKRLMYIIPTGLIIQFVIFKFLYPFPDFFGDSYSYIFAAQQDLAINIWPIGYSKFLLWFQWFTHSGIALTTFQYFFLEGTLFYFYQTLIYFYPTKRTLQIILCIFFFFNPLNLYVSNYVSSDGMFWAFSLIWLTELLWVLNRSNLMHLIILSVAFLFAFTFRYNAMYYPGIAALAFLVSKQALWTKIIGVCAGPAFIIPFIIWSSNAVKEISGSAQFPPILGGWQWGNNALYIREYIQEDSTKFPTSQMAELDLIARHFFRTVPPQYRELQPYIGNFFIRQPDAPLKQYMAKHYNNGVVKDWAAVAPLFKQYGTYIIKRHPWAFFQYFMLMNTKNYFVPPLEKLDIYNLGSNHVSDNAVQWFHYDNSKIHAFFPNNFQGYFLTFYPYLFLFLNIYFAWSLYFFIRQKGFKRADRRFSITIALIVIMVLANMGFSIFANIIAFRYQLFPMIILLSFSLLISEYTEQYLESKSVESKTIKEEQGHKKPQPFEPQL